MDDEFKLCWKNFQDNIASGFQNLYDRGDLVDVTLACDGKLLHAHKIVLAICSPYFQEIFITNPCKHPIIILKDVHFNIMCELLEFMYQGVVNVKHTELQSFMKIGQLLQIKGLATNSSTSALSEKFPNDIQNAKNLTTNLCSTDSITSSNIESEPKIDNDGMSKSAHLKTDATAIEANISPSSSPTPLSTNQQAKHTPDTPNSLQSYSNLKRNSDLNTDSLLIHSKKQLRRSISHDNSAGEQSDEHENGGGGVGVGGMEHVSPEDFFLSAIPHISMGEGSNRYELGNVKREGDHSNSSSSIPPSMRSSFGSSFGFEYNLYKNASGSNTGADFSNDLHLPNDYSKNFGNHMDIPPSSNNITMLSSTSLLHGNCVFNRNNTVATQQGMKTYWLCKSYRISMCRARCITHQGRVISATGVHNHPPHMRNGPPPTMPGGGYFNDSCTSSSLTVSAANSHCGGIPASNIPPSIQSGAVAAGGISSISNVGGSGGFSNLRTTSNMFPHSLNMPQQQNAQTTLQQQQQQLHQQSKSPPQLHSHPHLTQSAHPNLMIQQHTIAPLSNVNNNSNSLIFSHSGATTNLTPPISQTQSSVIQNMMQNVNIMHLPTMMNAVATPHSPRVRDSSNLNSNQVLTSGVSTTRQSSHSPSNLSDHNPHQQQRCNSIESVASNGRTMKSSPLSHSHHSSEHRVGGSGRDRGLSTNITEQVVLVQNAAELSPNYMHSPGDIDVDRNSSSLATRAADVANESRCNETQIIDSITISPGTGHNFKIEDM